MRELGMDLSGRTPRRLEFDDAEWADLVVTMGCGDACPVDSWERYFDWESLERLREIRGEIAVRIDFLIQKLDRMPDRRHG